MPYSTVQYTGNGSTTLFAVPFPFISRAHVSVTVDGVQHAFTWINNGQISISPAPGAGKLVTVARNSSRTTRLVDFQDGSQLTEADLDLANTQSVYISQEAFDASNVAEVTSEMTALRDAAAASAAGADASEAAALNYRQLAAASADSSAYFSEVSAANAASAEALNRVLKAGDTMTGELKQIQAGGTSYGLTRTFTWQDTSGVSGYKSWSWFQYQPLNIWEATNYDFLGALALGPVADDFTPTTAMLHFYVAASAAPHGNRITMGSNCDFWSSTVGIPVTSHPELFFSSAELTSLYVDGPAQVASLYLLPLADINGDFSNATHASRSKLVTTTFNGATNVGAAPSGTSLTSSYNAFGKSGVANCSYGQLLCTDASEVRLTAGAIGTGSYLPMTFWTGNAERMRISTAGSVGVGCTPNYDLDLTKTKSEESTRLNIANLSTSANAQAAVSIVQGPVEFKMSAAYGQGWAGTTTNHPCVLFTNNVERMRINAAGLVGIGRVPTTRKLEVEGDTYTNGAFKAVTGVHIMDETRGDSFSFSNGGAFAYDGGNVAYYGLTYQPSSTLYGVGLSAYGPLEFFTGGDRGMVLNNKQLGIGTSPSYRLHVASVGGNPEFRLTDGTDQFQLYVGSGVGSTTMGTVGAQALVLRTNATERFRLGSDGTPTFRPPASVTPAANGDLSFQITSNTQLTFKLKGSDGTVRSGSITLA